MTPTPCIATLAVCTSPMVGTFHASGDLGWMKIGKPVWGFLAERLDRRIAVSEMARTSANAWLPGDYEIVPNGVLVPPAADPGNRENRIVFGGRHEQRKGLHVLLRAWPRIRKETGATLRLCGADPLRVRLLISQLRIDGDGIDILGFLPQEDYTRELLAAKALVAPSLGGESFGIVLVRALACATPVVASDIAGYRDVMTPETCVAFPAGDVDALADAVVGLVADEERRASMGAAGRELARSRYAWDAIARRLDSIYREAVA
jgi:phosphatidylinositol alpha-mannosyltransferase